MEENNVEKKIVTTGKMTRELICGFFVYGILYSILYSIITSLVLTNIENTILRVIISIILQLILVLLIWDSSVKSSFKKNTIYLGQVSSVMKNLIIFTIIVCVVSAISNLKQAEINFEQSMDSKYKLEENFVSYLYNDEEMEEYKEQKEEIINETKEKLMIYMIFIEIGVLAIYLGVLPVVKKNISKYAIRT